MPRPCKQRRCRTYNGDQVFKPRSIPMHQLTAIRLELSELEAMRLCDLEGHDQEAAGRSLPVSRGTVQRPHKRGRTKVLRALLDSSALLIEKGDHDEDLHTNSG